MNYFLHIKLTKYFNHPFPLLKVLHVNFTTSQDIPVQTLSSNLKSIPTATSICRVSMEFPPISCSTLSRWHLDQVTEDSS